MCKNHMVNGIHHIIASKPRSRRIRVWRCPRVYSSGGRGAFWLVPVFKIILFVHWIRQLELVNNKQTSLGCVMMEDFLENCHLGHLVEIFRENDITLEIAKKLDDNELKELIPSIGQRKTFTEALRKEDQAFVVTVPAADITEYQLIDVTNITDSPSSPTSTLSIASTSCVPQDHRQLSFCGIENAFQKVVLPEFDLKTLLETTPLGSTILSYYDKYHSLNSYKRSLLVDIIIKRVFNFIVAHRLTHADYNILTSKIITLFPKECAGTYYVPAVSKKHSLINRPIIAKGKLVDKVRNLLRVNREIKLDEKKSTVVEPEFDQTIKNDKLWLGTRTDPWPEVMDKWRRTFEMRRKTVASTLESFFREWPILKDPRSNTLIDIDYDLMYPESTINLHFKWLPFMERLVGMRKNSIMKDRIASQYLELLETEISDDTKVALHISLLPLLIPPKSRMKIDNKHWKFSSSEVSESLLMHVKTPGDINKSIEDYRLKMHGMKQTVQPYVLVEGPTLLNINASYVVVDTVRFKCDSVLKAVDLTFKLFHVCNACYPKQSEYLWILIQKAIYQISTSQDKVIPYILDLIESLKDCE